MQGARSTIDVWQKLMNSGGKNRHKKILWPGTFWAVGAQSYSDSFRSFCRLTEGEISGDLQQPYDNEFEISDEGLNENTQQEQLMMKVMRGKNWYEKGSLGRLPQARIVLRIKGKYRLSNELS